MATLTSILAHHWNTAVASLGGTALGTTTAELGARYAEPSRHYHTAQHISEVLEVAGLLAAGYLTKKEGAFLTLAALAHDVVYESAPGSDEEKSALWVHLQMVDAGIDFETGLTVANLVRSTAAHSPSAENLLEQALSDADLWILASPQARYDEYTRQVRQEWAHVSGPQWAAGRSALLRGFLARESVYSLLSSEFDAAAKRNMTRELTTLT